MKNLARVLLGLMLVLLMVNTSWAVNVTATFPVISSTDDHEEDGDGNSRGIDSGDLDLGKDSGEKILVGLRFQNVTVPQGAVIVNAYVEFVAGSGVEAHSNPQTVRTKMTIKGQLSANAPTFATNKKNIKDRWEDYDTDASVTWNVPTSEPWNDNARVQTNSITRIVQEIVDLNAWSSGNALVIMLRRNDVDSKRLAYSWDGLPAKAPVLVIEYESSSSGGGGGTETCTQDIRVSSNTDDADDREDAVLFNRALRFGDKWVGMRFTSVDVPQGAEITNAVLKLATGVTNTGASNQNDGNKARVDIWGQKSSNAATFTTAEDNIKDRPRTSSNVQWTENNDWDTYKETHTSPDISKIVQEIVGQSGWSAGNAMVMLLEDDKGRRPILAHDDVPASAPLLHIEYTCGSGGTSDPDPQPTIELDVASSTEVYLGASSVLGTAVSGDILTVTNRGGAPLNYTITGTPSWLTLSRSTGTLTAAGDAHAITVTYDGSGLGAGTHQSTLTVSDPTATTPELTVPVSWTIYTLPAGATSCNNVPLYVQNRISPAVLVNLDLSGSMQTMMSVSQEADLPRSPDLASIVQEIVNTGNSWISGNDMAFIVTGSGARRAWSYDGQSGSAPRLFVTYRVGFNTPVTISKRISERRDDAEQRTDNSNFSDSKSELNFGSRVIGMRFQGLNIPDGATIINAYIEFSVSSPDSSATSLTFYGEQIDDAPRFTSTSGEDVTRRTKTTNRVTWASVPEWKEPTEQSRLAIAQNVISEIVKNRNISWGFGTWTGDYSSSSSVNYTKIEVGCKLNTDAQQADLQAAIQATRQGGRTPFVPSMYEAGRYFAGTKADESGGTFVDLSCQDKFVIEVTDGLGNIPDNTSATAAANQTQALADAGISTVAVGFGIDNATMINAVAQKANDVGDNSETDNIYALHETDPGNTNPATNGVPFLAMNQDELLDSLLKISRKIENRFTGSAPAPTTSADDDDLLMVLIAEFGSASWTGDLRARGYSLVNHAWTSELWVASEMVPASRSVWTVNASDAEIFYEYSTQYTARTFCKDIGDIINSAPIIIKWPNSYYALDGYQDFFNTYKNRKKVAYVGANDGQLHAFLLTDIKDSGGTVTTPAGTELWSFIPKSLLAKLKLADTDTTFDMCDTDYCHQYYVDGSPQAADIYADSAWRTIMVTGLREGGESYFALDITDGEPMSSGSGGAKYLWEFTDSELGQTWGDARINRVIDITASDATTADGYDRVWGTFFGSGYAGAGPASTAQTYKQAYLYGINAYDKSNLWVTAAGVSTNRIKMTSATLNNDALSELLLVDKDTTTDFMEDFIFTGNLYGDLFRVTNIGKGQTPAASVFYESNNSTTAAPIRARASYTLNPHIPGGFWLYFGTGRYELVSDKVTTEQQYFFGLEEVPDADGNYTRKYIKPATLGTVTIPTNMTTRLSAAGTVANPGNPVDLAIVALKATGYSVNYTDAAGDAQTRLVKVVEGQNPLKEPWAIRLGTDTTYSERVVNQPLVVGKIVFFTSFIPDNDACGGSGKSYLYAVDFQTGKAPTAIVFDVNGDGLYNDADKVNGEPVAAIGVGDGMATQPVIIGNKIFLNTTDPDEETKVIEPNLPNPVTLRSWFDRSFE